MTVPHRRITTKRLILRRPLPSDAEDLFRCLSNEEVCRTIDVTRHRTLKDTEEFLDRLIGEYEAKILTEWIIEERTAKKAIGIINLYSFSENSAYTGYFLEKDSWGHGFATEALAVLKDHVFSETEIETLYALCLPDNKASLRVLEKCGFFFEKKGEYRGGKNDGEMIYRFAAEKSNKERENENKKESK